MKTPWSRKCSVRRMRSPSSAPWVNGEEGSIESTPTVAPRLSPRLGERADQRGLADAGRTREAVDGGFAGVGVDLAHELPALGAVVLDERDGARERTAVAVEQALGERGGHARKYLGKLPSTHSPPGIPGAARSSRMRARETGSTEALRTWRWMRAHNMINRHYVLLGWRAGLSEAALWQALSDRRACASSARA